MNSHELIVIGGHKKSGKTTLLANLIDAEASHVLMCSQDVLNSRNGKGLYAHAYLLPHMDIPSIQDVAETMKRKAT